MRILGTLAFALAVCSQPAAAQLKQALVIGVKDYPGYAENSIRFADTDALAFRMFLESGGAGQVEVNLLTNSRATREKILDAVADLRHAGSRPDTLFVFFSGHAELDHDTDEVYLMPTDGDKKRLSATGLLATEFITQLKAVGATNLLIFLDACHTGGAVGKGGSNELSLCEAQRHN